MTRSDDKRALLLVDPLADDTGHLLDDDLFLAECLAPLSNEFKVISSPTSVDNIRKCLAIRATPTKDFSFLRRFFRARCILQLITLPCSQYQDVVFQSLEEVSVLLFMALHPKKRAHLIMTNNLSRERMDRHPFLWRFFMGATLRRAASVIVHSRFEVDFIRRFWPQVDSRKVFIKPFHQIAASRSRPKWSFRSQTILFMGPVVDHKPIEPVIELIKKDAKRRYRYVLRGMDGIGDEARAFLRDQPNVDLGFGYVANEEYYRLCSEMALVILTHNKLFEGKMSGILSDAIASGTPVIARDMAPHNELFERFGPMGFLVDYNDSQWCEFILTSDLSSKYEGFQRNMSACRESCTTEAIRDVFRVVLNRA